MPCHAKRLDQGADVEIDVGREGEYGSGGRDDVVCKPATAAREPDEAAAGTDVFNAEFAGGTRLAAVGRLDYHLHFATARPLKEQQFRDDEGILARIQGKKRV